MNKIRGGGRPPKLILRRATHSRHPDAIDVIVRGDYIEVHSNTRRYIAIDGYNTISVIAQLFAEYEHLHFRVLPQSSGVDFMTYVKRCFADQEYTWEKSETRIDYELEDQRGDLTILHGNRGKKRVEKKQNL